MTKVDLLFRLGSIEWIPRFLFGQFFWIPLQPVW